MNFFRTLLSIVTILCFSVLLTTLAVSCCKKNDNDPPPELPKLDSTKHITSFTIVKADGIALNSTEVIVELKSDSILVGIPAGTNLTRLMPAVTFKGVLLVPSATAEQDFSKPVEYTVTAEDNSKRKYVVVVKNLPVRNRVFTGGNNNTFYALDAVTGMKHWEFTGTKSFAYSSPAFKDSVVYVGSSDSYVYAFHAITGKVLWKFLTGSTGIEAPVTIDGNTVYVGCNDDIFYALDAQTGTEKWRYATNGDIKTGAVVVNGTVYFGCSDSKVYALNTANGTMKWSYATGDMINISGPAVSGGVVYVGSRDKYLHAINAATGTMMWKFHSGYSLEMSGATVVNGVVYIGGWIDWPDFNKPGSLFAIDATTGNLIWEKFPKSGFSSSPTVSNGLLYVCADGGVFQAINAATGNLVWSKRISPFSSNATVADGRVFAGGGANHSYYNAYDAVTGADKWEFANHAALFYSGALVLDSQGKAHYPGSSGMAQ
jgi:outer membrane protein assembly factor BamB